MLKKLFLACSPLVFLAAQLAAQESPQKVLLVIGTSQNVSALKRAIQFKQAGLEVRVIFERDGILPFLDLYKVLETPGWKKKMEAIAQENAVHVSSAVKGPLGDSTVPHPKLKLVGMSLKAHRPTGALLQKMKDERIPYTLCSASAKHVFEVYDELKATGEPMSADAEGPIDISPYVKQGYQVLVY